MRSPFDRAGGGTADYECPHCGAVEEVYIGHGTYECDGCGRELSTSDAFSPRGL